MNEGAEVETEEESPQSDQVESEGDSASIWSRLAGLVGGKRKKPEPRTEPPTNGQKARE